MYFMQPSKEELAEQRRIQDSIMMARQEAAILDSIRFAEEQQQAAEEQALASIPEVEMDSATAVAHQYQVTREKFGVFASASAGEEQSWILENQLQRITLSNKGGFIKQVELKNYQTYDSLPLISFDPETAVLICRSLPTTASSTPLNFILNLLSTDSPIWEVTCKPMRTTVSFLSSEPMQMT